MLITLKDMTTKDYPVERITVYRKGEICLITSALDFTNYCKHRGDFEIQAADSSIPLSLYCPQDELKTERSFININLHDNIDNKDYFIWKNTLYIPANDANDPQEYPYYRDKYVCISIPAAKIQVVGYESYVDFLQDNKTIIKDKFVITGECEYEYSDLGKKLEAFREKFNGLGISYKTEENLKELFEAFVAMENRG